MSASLEEIQELLGHPISVYWKSCGIKQISIGVLQYSDNLFHVWKPEGGAWVSFKPEAVEKVNSDLHSITLRAEEGDTILDAEYVDA
ncbi:MAG TPA: hypothetical protein VN256_13130 [Pyrinomonadaceae bacterium]|nr:hypothetical protein [Pyrinomonadaceae bacterium]